MFRSSLAAAAACAISLAALPAHAGPNLVTDGDFQSFSSGAAPDGVCYSGGPANCLALTYWTNTDGYSFVSNSGNANLGNGVYGNIGLWSVAATPDGGNYLAADGLDIGVPKGPTSQMLNGLVVGAQYAVSFYQAAGQQSGFSGATTEQWMVSLGSQTLDSTLMNNPSEGFTNWNYQTLTFTATSTSEALSFLAYGTPDGQPPFVLLNDVSATELVPEPAATAMLAAGIAGLVLARRRRHAASL
jgi:hypothetical protein